MEYEILKFRFLHHPDVVSIRDWLRVGVNVIGYMRTYVVLGILRKYTGHNFVQCTLCYISFLFNNFNLIADNLIAWIRYHYLILVLCLFRLIELHWMNDDTDSSLYQYPARIFYYPFIIVCSRMKIKYSWALKNAIGNWISKIEWSYNSKQPIKLWSITFAARFLDKSQLELFTLLQIDKTESIIRNNNHSFWALEFHFVHFSSSMNYDLVWFKGLFTYPVALKYR